MLPVPKHELQRSVNLVGNLYALASQRIAALWKQAVLAMRTRTDIATASGHDSMVNYFPVTDSLFEICVRYRNSQSIDDAFIYSLYDAVRCYGVKRLIRLTG